MQEGKVDALLMAGALPITGLRFDPLYEDHFVGVVSRRNPLAGQTELSVESLREVPVIASRLKDCRFHQPFLHSILAPFGISPKIVESPYSCTVQFAYAAADEGIALAPQLMESCTFPGVVTRPFRESLPTMQLGLSAMRNNDSRAMTIFRRVVQDCAAEAFGRKTTPAAARRPKAAQPPVMMFPTQREAS
jgi:DNA-binding transcriptional LysR family regulator